MITWLVRHLTRVPIAHPKSVLAAALILTLISAVFVPRLYISTDRNLLAGKNDPSARRRDEVNRMFGTSLVAAVIIAGRDDPVEVRKAADELAAGLSRRKDMIREVFHKADIAFFERHALLFMPKEQLERLTAALARGDAGLDVFEKTPDLPSLISAWADRTETATLPEDSRPEDVDAALGFFAGIVDDLTTWLQDPAAKDLDLVGKLWTSGPAMSGSAASEGYLMDKDGKAPRLAVLYVQPTNDSQAMEVVGPFTDAIRQEAAGIAAKHPGFKTYVTGMPALTTDEMRVVERDIFVTGIIAALGVLVIFGLTFRAIRITLFAALPLGLGIMWATAVAAILYGHLTMVSGYFAAQLFGLGVAYTIYIVSRMHEALLAGEDTRAAVATAVSKAGPGVVGSSLTVAAAFFAVALSDFQAFSELGVIAGVGTLLILAANLTLLPATLLLWHPGRGAVRVSVQGAFWGALGRAPAVVPIAGVLLFVVGLAVVPKIGFDYAVESLLPGGADSVIGLKLMDKRTDFSTSYSISLSGSLEEAGRMRERFAALPTVARAESLSMFVPPDQAGRLAVLVAASPAVRDQAERAEAAVQGFRGNLGRTTRAEMVAALQKLEDALQDAAFAAVETHRREAPMLKTLTGKVGRAREAMAALKDDTKVRSLERQLFDALARGLKVLANGFADRGFGADDLPVAIRGRYLGRDGRSHAVIITPKGDIGNRDFFERHVAELLSVDPNTTGHPVTHLAFTHLIHRGFTQAAILAAIAVTILILLDLRRPRDFAMAALPVVLGAGWTAAVLALFDLKFNYANLMAIPILIGTGVDFGINLAHRTRQEDSVLTAVRTTGKAIAISGSTALVGFGSLLLGQHWGVRSLGIVLVVGIASCFIISIVILPSLLGRREAGKKPDKP